MKVQHITARQTERPALLPAALGRTNGGVHSIGAVHIPLFGAR